MKQAKALMVMVTLLVSVLLTGSSFAQVTASDYFGVWTGQDNMKNNIEITFNSNYSCIYKVDGVTSFNITGYKIMFDADGDGIANPSKCEIWFYSTNAPVPVPNMGVAPNQGGNTIYKSMSSLGGANLDELVFTGDLPTPLNSVATDGAYSITVNK